MARPLFMICSEFGVVDRYSNTVSAFNILESIQIYEAKKDNLKLEAGASVSPIFRLRMVATWISDEEDRKHEYQYETRLHLPGKEPHTASSGLFRWTTQNHRFIVDFGSLNPDPGTLLIVNAIRRVGEDSEWLTQQYEITIERPEVPATTH